MKRKIFQMLLLGMCVLFTSNIFAQVKVSGVVKSSSGEILPGATIVVKGTTNGVVTDADGKYSITVPSTNSTLIVSFIGMENKAIALNGKTSVNLTLAPTIENLDEVVVTALGMKRSAKSLGYNVNQVNSENLQTAGVGNALKSLEGKVTGVQMNSLSSSPTSSVLFTIRGATSLGGLLSGSGATINNSTQPLIVIDGIPVSTNQIGSVSGIDVGNRMSSINPDDIESVSILKGAGAAALYGSAAGSGVVLVTTKNGAKAKKGLGVTYSNEFSIERTFNTPPVQRQFMRDAEGDQAYMNGPDGGGWDIKDSKNINANGPVPQWNLMTQQFDYKLQGALGDKDPLKAFLQTGAMETNNLSITGNYDKGSYRFNYTNMLYTSVVPNNQTTRNSLSFNSTYKLNNKISITSEASYTHTFTPQQANIQGHLGDNAISVAMTTPIDMPKMSVFRNSNPWLNGFTGIYQNTPYLKKVNETGNVRFAKNNSDGSDGNVGSDNPYFDARYNIRTYSRDVAFGKVQLDYELQKYLRLTLRTGLDFETFGLEHKIPWDSKNNNKGGYEETNSTSLAMNSDAMLNFNKGFLNNKLSVDATGGVNFAYSESSGSSFSGTDGLVQPNAYSFSAISQNSKNNANIFRNIGGRSYSVYGTASIGWASQVYLDLSGRNDWVGVLAPQKVSKFYPGGSLSWLLSETFKNQLPWADLLKLRGGIAETGYGIGHPYNLDTYGIAGSYWNGVTMGTVGGALVDPNIKPELNITKEGGVDFGILNNRISGDFTIYEKRHINQIQSIPVTSSSGFASLQTNIGAVKSNGLEASLTVVPVRNKTWEWSLNGSFSTFKSVVQDLDSRFTTTQISYVENTNFYLYKGATLGDMYAQQPLPIIQSGAYKGQVLIDPDNGTQDVSKGLSPALAKKIGFIGNINPKAVWSFNTNVKYKNWNLGVVTSFRVGGAFVSGTARRLGDDALLDMKKYFGKNYSKYYAGGRYAGGLPSMPDPSSMFPGSAWATFRNDVQYYMSTYNGDPRYFGYLKGVFINPTTAGDLSQYNADARLSLADNSYMVNGANPTQTLYFQPYYMEGQNFWKNSQFISSSATCFKIKEINLTYKLDKNLASKLMCQDISFTAFAKNVMYWAKNNLHEDPENAFDGSAVNGLGGSNYTVPPVRIMGLKVTVGF